MTWGLCVSALGSLAMCITLAEICHVYPSMGGQYDWAYILAPEGYRRGLAWIAGWMTAVSWTGRLVVLSSIPTCKQAGWVSVTATGSSLGASFVIGLVSLWNENYEPKPFHTFLVYLAFTIGAFLLNTFAVRALPFVDRMALFWSLAGIVTVIIVVLTTAKGSYEPGKFVFTTFVNETGWPGGVAFLLGLLQSTFGLTGFDAISHMIEGE
jgi:choline transport protein